MAGAFSIAELNVKTCSADIHILITSTCPFQVAAKIWPDVTFYVRQFLTGDLEPKIQSSLPSKLKSFTFDRIDLGDMVSCYCHVSLTWPHQQTWYNMTVSLLRLYLCWYVWIDIMPFVSKTGQQAWLFDAQFI